MQAIAADVRELLSADKSGHGMDHVERVMALADKFAVRLGLDQDRRDIIALAALLHDVDDYKIFGEAHANGLLNASRLLAKHNVSAEHSQDILAIISSMGYSKYLEGVRPITLEGQIVSDADMCDAIGAMGILRTHAYALSRGEVFFDPTALPVAIPTAAEYKANNGHAPAGTTSTTSTTAAPRHSVQHFFDKLLLIPQLMMTEPGRFEAENRHGVMIDFLRNLFTETGSLVWLERLSMHLEAAFVSWSAHVDLA